MITVNGPVDREQLGPLLQFHVFAALPRPTMTSSTSANDDTSTTTSCALVQLTLVDVDDNSPRFLRSYYAFSVLENATVGSYVGQVRAVDPDIEVSATAALSSTSTFGYRLIDSSFFTVDSTTGTIRVAWSLDRESIARHELVVTVTGAVTSSARDEDVVSRIVVDVIDVNDNRPIFLFPSNANNTLRLRHNLPIGSSIARLVAVDVDADNNANLTYCSPAAAKHDVAAPSAASAFFHVLPSSGLVLTAGNLSELRQVSGISRPYALVVCAFDAGQPSLTSTASLFLHIVDPPETGDYLRADYDDVIEMGDIGAVSGHVHVLVVAVVAFFGCVAVVGICSSVAVLVTRRVATWWTPRGAGVGGLSLNGKVRNVTWRKVSSCDVTIPADAETTEETTKTAAQQHPNHGLVHQHPHPHPPPPAARRRRQEIADLDDSEHSSSIILTLDSEPVNYAVSDFGLNYNDFFMAGLASYVLTL